MDIIGSRTWAFEFRLVPKSVILNDLERRWPLFRRTRQLSWRIT